MSSDVSEVSFIYSDFEKVYREIRESEKEAKNILTEFDKAYPGEMKGENINTIIEQARRKRKNESADE
jgi:hypothetical protein